MDNWFWLQILKFESNIYPKKKDLTTAESANSFAAVTRIRTWVTSATTKGTNHYTITAIVVR